MEKKFFIFLFVILICLPAVSAYNQEEEEEILFEQVLKYLPYTISTAALEDDAQHCKVLMVGATDYKPTNAFWSILDYVAEYISGSKWNMILVAGNISSQPVPIKVEFELRWNDGAGRQYKKWSRTIDAGTVMMYMFDITSKIKQLGLFHLTGRISGKYVGINNVVHTQLYIY